MKKDDLDFLELRKKVTIRRRRWLNSIADQLIDLAADRERLQQEADHEASVERAAEKRKATRLAAQRERAARYRAERKPVGWWSRKSIGKLWGWKVMLARMEPDAWYALPDLVVLMPEYATRSVKAWLYQKLWAGQWVERIENPARDRTKHHRRQTEPVYLWKVREGKASAVAQEWRQTLGNGMTQGPVPSPAGGASLAILDGNLSDVEEAVG